MDPSRQSAFDITIGRLERILSLLVGWAKQAPQGPSEFLDPPNLQTLKHHAEDMIAAGNKILECLGKGVEGTPQPK
jgi:hypothetical protein